MPRDGFYEEEVVSEVEEDDIVAMEEEEKVEHKEEKTDFIYDQVRGGMGKKHVLSDLNKKKLGNHEMDEMFCDWY